MNYNQKGLIYSIIAVLPIIIGVILGIILRSQGISAEQGQFYSIPTVSAFLLITPLMSFLTLYYGVKAKKIEKKNDSLISGMLLLFFFLTLIIVFAAGQLTNPNLADVIFNISLTIPFVVFIFSVVKLIILGLNSRNETATVKL